MADRFVSSGLPKDCAAKNQSRAGDLHALKGLPKKQSGKRSAESGSRYPQIATVCTGRLPIEEK